MRKKYIRLVRKIIDFQKLIQKLNFENSKIIFLKKMIRIFRTKNSKIFGTIETFFEVRVGESHSHKTVYTICVQCVHIDGESHTNRATSPNSPIQHAHSAKPA